MLELSDKKNNSNIMKTETFRAESLIAFFRRQQIATMDQLKAETPKGHSLKSRCQQTNPPLTVP